jgi:hypothetical protein
MTLTLRQLQRLSPQLHQIIAGLQIEHSKNRTHRTSPFFPASNGHGHNEKGPHGAGLFRVFSWNPNYAKARQRVALLFALLLMLLASTTDCATGAAVVETLAVTELMARLKQIPRANASPSAHPQSNISAATRHAAAR